MMKYQHSAPYSAPGVLTNRNQGTDKLFPSYATRLFANVPSVKLAIKKKKENKTLQFLLHAQYNILWLVKDFHPRIDTNVNCRQKPAKMPLWNTTLVIWKLIFCAWPKSSKDEVSTTKTEQTLRLSDVGQWLSSKPFKFFCKSVAQTAENAFLPSKPSPRCIFRQR